MSRRPSLPGADELFRRTEPPTDQDPAESAVTAAVEVTEAGREPAAARTVRPAARRRGRTERRPTGRERHEEKITVYVSPEELFDLEHAKLTLRAQHGLAVDRGRIVREAVAFVVADLEASGDESILVRRLRGL